MGVGEAGMKLGLIRSWNPKMRIGTLMTADGMFFLNENEILEGWGNIRVGAEVLFLPSERKTLPGKLPNATNAKVLK
jgi:hypothetical protein